MAFISPKDMTESQLRAIRESHEMVSLNAEEQTLCNRALMARLLTESMGIHDVADTIRDLRLAWMGKAHSLPPGQRAGTTPRTVEVGMLLCRPADGTSAAVWCVESIRAGVNARLSYSEKDDRHLHVATAAIVHEAGGWVLAADWTPQEGGA